MRLNARLWHGAAAGIGLLAVAVASADDKVGRRGIVEPGEQLLDESGIVEPGKEFKGKSYNELVSDWNNWLVKEPIATNPAFDPDGRFCDRNQEGIVWFLASTFVGVADRTCDVPADKAIFISLGGVFISFSPDFPVARDPCLSLETTLERVRCDVNNDVQLAPRISFKASIDGVPVKDLFAFRAQSPPGGFTLRIPEGSLFTEFGFSPGDRFPAVADGYFLLLKPLKPGEHTLSVSMTNLDQSETGVNYTLIVPSGPRP
jgi:hypothetical protein